MRFDRRTVLGAATAAAVCSVAMSGAAAQQRMIFATQDPGTLYHTMGGGFARLLSEQLERQVTIQPYGGSSIYLPLLDNGEAALGFSSALDAGAAYNGKGREPLTSLRAVARILGLRTAYMVRADSGIETIEDLEGKRVVTDLKGQAAMGKVMRAMLATGDLGPDDVEPITLGNVAQGSTALIEGNVDATFIAIGIPLVKQAHAGIPGGVAYVDLGPGASVEVMGEEADGVYPAEVQPTAAMPEVAEPVTVSAFDIHLLTGADTPEEVVHDVEKAVYDNFEQRLSPLSRRPDGHLLGEHGGGARAREDAALGPPAAHLVRCRHLPAGCSFDVHRCRGRRQGALWLRLPAQHRRDARLPRAGRRAAVRGQEGRSRRQCSAHLRALRREPRRLNAPTC
jgi:TRAP transporter TAXI family solute receptor